MSCDRHARKEVKRVDLEPGLARLAHCFPTLSAQSHFYLPDCYSLVRDHKLFLSVFLHHCVSGHLNYGCDSLSSPVHRRHLPLSVSRPACSFTIARRNHAMPLLSLTVQQVVYTSLPQQCFKSPNIHEILFSFRLAISGS